MYKAALEVSVDPPLNISSVWCELLIRKFSTTFHLSLGERPYYRFTIGQTTTECLTRL